MKVYTPYMLGDLLIEAKNNPHFLYHLEPYVDSYRGYYDHVAMEPAVGGISGALLHERLARLIGTTMQGYKGGDYLVHEGCQVFLAYYGETGPMLVGFTDDGEPIGCYESRVV